MNKIEKIRIPEIKIITISDDRTIHIDGQIFGGLVVRLLNDDGSGFIEGYKVKIPTNHSGEYGCLTIVPEAWVGKNVMVSYEREVDSSDISYEIIEGW